MSTSAARGATGSPLTSEVPISASHEFQGYLPFPDNQGHLIPFTNEPQQYLPFPDNQGSLIPVKHGEPGSPFPLDGQQQSK